jgi:hypothetical protein
MLRVLSAKEPGRRLFLGVLAAALVALALPAASGATMPGNNGRLAFEKFSEKGEAETELQLYSVNSDGSDITQLTSGKDSSEGAYSPDGSLLAFDRYNELWLAAADGSGAHAIAVGSEQETEPTRWVANYEDPETGKTYPWVKIDERRDQRDIRSEPAFSPDGKTLAVEHYTGTFVIGFVCSVNAKNEQSCNGTYDGIEVHCDDCGSSIEAIDASTGAPLATLVPRTSGVQLTFPAYSSKGALAYTREAEGAFTEREILAIAAPGAAPVTLAKGEVREPDFSPDGTRVVFTSGRHDIGIVDATGGTPTIIPAPAPVAEDQAWFTRSPVWSPDGSLIAFGNAGARKGMERLRDGGVYLIHPDGSNLTLIQGNGTTPNSWQPIPIPPSPPAPIAARALKGKKKIRLNKRGVASVAKIVCGSSPCALKATKTKLKVGKKRYGVKAMVGTSLAASATAQLKIKVKGKALAALKAKHHGVLDLTLSVTDVTGTQSLGFKPKVLPAAGHRKKKR